MGNLFIDNLDNDDLLVRNKKEKDRQFFDEIVANLFNAYKNLKVVHRYNYDPDMVILITSRCLKKFRIYLNDDGTVWVNFGKVENLDPSWDKCFIDGNLIIKLNRDDKDLYKNIKNINYILIPHGA